MTRNSGRTHAPLRETLKKLFTQIIAANRGNRVHGYGEPMQMISDIKRCAAGKRTMREKIPEHFAET
jgi:hypothetical protein